MNQLKSQMEEKELKEFLAKSLVVMNVGNNDYLNNYLMPSIYQTSSIYNPREFADILARNYTAQILVNAELYWFLDRSPSFPKKPTRLFYRIERVLISILRHRKCHVNVFLALWWTSKFQRYSSGLWQTQAVRFHHQDRFSSCTVDHESFCLDCADCSKLTGFLVMPPYLAVSSQMQWFILNFSEQTISQQRVPVH